MYNILNLKFVFWETGHLFQDRYKSIVTQDQNYIEELILYMHLNPLRARICKDTRELDKILRYLMEKMQIEEIAQCICDTPGISLEDVQIRNRQTISSIARKIISFAAFLTVIQLLCHFVRLCKELKPSDLYIIFFA